MNKSTLDAYTQAAQTVEQNGLISFDNAKRTGCSIEFVPGSTQINLSAGLYLIIFSAYGAESGTSGDITVQLNNNGVQVPGAISSVNSAATTDLEPLSFSKIICVAPSCACVKNNAVLSFVNSGVGATFNNVIVDVVRLA